jgi:hypothetical protein
MIRGELDAVLSRPRYGRRVRTADGAENATEVVGPRPCPDVQLSERGHSLPRGYGSGSNQAHLVDDLDRPATFAADLGRVLLREHPEVLAEVDKGGALVSEGPCGHPERSRRGRP